MYNNNIDKIEIIIVKNRIKHIYRKKTNKFLSEKLVSIKQLEKKLFENYSYYCDIFSC